MGKKYISRYGPFKPCSSLRIRHSELLSLANKEKSKTSLWEHKYCNFYKKMREGGYNLKNQTEKSRSERTRTFWRTSLPAWQWGQRGTFGTCTGSYRSPQQSRSVTRDIFPFLNFTLSDGIGFFTKIDSYLSMVCLYSLEMDLAIDDMYGYW